MPDRATSERLIDYYNDQVSELTRQLADDEIDVGTWQITMRQLLRDAFADQLRAGAAPETPVSSDYLMLGPLLRAQYEYLEGFARDIAAGFMSFDQITARARLYVGASREAYWLYVTRGVKLPAYPGDGSSECLGNCGCEWVEKPDGSGQWYWQRGKDDSCPTCIEREINWAPYVP